MQDPKLVSKIRKGDGDSLKLIFKECAPKMYGLALRMTGDPDTSEQIVQAVFEELWKNKRRLDPLHPLATTLYRETYICAKALQPNHELVNVDTPESEDPRMKPLIDHLVQLEPLPRLVFLLYTAHGFTVRELARTLDVSEEFIISYLAKAFSGLDDLIRQGVV